MTRGPVSRRGFVRGGLAAAVLPLAVGCGHRVQVASAPAPSSAGLEGAASLRSHAQENRLYYGCAVDVAALASDPDYARLVREQAGMVVAENAMKWDALRPSAGAFSFEEADAFVAFAESAALKMRGHCLCWGRQLPAWFAAGATVDNARGFLLEHIRVVAGRYAGRMHSWDVVNEAVEVKDGRPDGLRDSPWLRLVGPDYLEAAFRAAREADPDALLTYNEYGLEGEDPASLHKRVAVLELLRRLKARRVPLDALGLQAHLTAGDRFGPGLMAFLAAVRQLGMQVFVTELDVNDRNLPADVAARDAAVARVYADFVGLVLHEPALNVVMTWGLTDRYTWLKDRKDGLPERCLPFDSEGDPAPAFFSLRKSLDTRRNTALRSS